jgi:hypothetical protein
VAWLEIYYWLLFQSKSNLNPDAKEFIPGVKYWVDRSFEEGLSVPTSGDSDAQKGGAEVGGGQGVHSWEGEWLFNWILWFWVMCSVLFYKPLSISLLFYWLVWSSFLFYFVVFFLSWGNCNCFSFVRNVLLPVFKQNKLTKENWVFKKYPLKLLYTYQEEGAPGATFGVC